MNLLVAKVILFVIGGFSLAVGVSALAIGDVKFWDSADDED